MRVLIALDQSDMAIWTFRAFLELDIKDKMEIEMLYMHHTACCETTHKEMRRNASGASAIAVRKLVDENKLENEAEALIQHIKDEFKEELAVFNNTINVVYTELDGSNPRLVINKTLEHIEATNPDKIVFGIRGIVRLRETVNEIEAFKKQCQLVKHKECLDCKKAADKKAKQDAKKDAQK